MGKIHVLNENISNKIAAGEVVERPSSVIKELIENSIDANASSITIEIKDGGISYIRISDNGIGMDSEDAKISFIRHSTSKISSESDLFYINTLGFRGEALASIASVAYIEMLTKQKEDNYGTKINIEGGELKYIETAGCSDGTTITVKNLFYNTPARLKFLKKESREAAIISDMLLKLSLSRPDISFKYINNNKLIFNTPGDGSLKNTILILYGKDTYSSLININYSNNYLSINGFVGSSKIARSNRNHQVFFVNNRLVKNKILSTAVDNAYKTYLTINKFAFCIIFIDINPELIDVNVHPTKSEIRFQNESEIFSAIFNTVRNGLTGEILIPNLSFDEDDNKEIHVKDNVYEIEKQENLFDSNIIEDTKYLFKENSKLQENNKTYMDIEPVKESSIENIDFKSILPPLIVLGQCHYTYILAQGPDGLYIIDQHAAHERIMYEKFKDSYESSGIQSQELLVPLVIEMTPDEIIIIKENIEKFHKLGFDIDNFGNNSLIIRAVPIIFGEPQLKKLFIEIVDNINSNNLSGSSNFIDKSLYTLACKSAVKANDKLSDIEMSELLNMLRLTNNPYNCPHGRPTIIKMSKYELEKKFKRIQ